MQTADGLVRTALRNLKIRRVALVDKGANQEAFVTLYKRDTTEEGAMDEADLQKVSDSVLVRLAKAIGFDPTKKKDTVEGAGADDAAAAAVAKQQADALALKDTEIRKRDEEIATLKDAEQAKTFIAKAAKLPAMGKSDVFGPVLHKISKAVTPEEFAAFEKALTSLEAIAHKSPLFKELGVAGEIEGTPKDRLQAMADARVKKAQDDGKRLSPQQAYAEALHSDEGQKLYAEIRKADIDRYAVLRQEGD